MTMEIEIKLALKPEHKMRIHDLPLVRDAESRGHKRVISTYYDSPTFDLRRQGVAFRVRKHGNRWLQTLKREGRQVAGLSAREELETALSGDRPDYQALEGSSFEASVGPVASLLRPLFVTDFTRHAWLLHLPGETRVEMVLDEGEVRATDRSMPILEIELELKAGSQVHMLRTARALAESLIVYPETLSKAARGYRLAGIRAEPPRQETTAAKTFEETMHHHLQELQQAETIARYDDSREGARLMKRATLLMQRTIRRDADPGSWSGIADKLERLASEIESGRPGSVIESQAYCPLMLDILILLQKNLI